MTDKLVSKNMPTDNRGLRDTLISNFEILQQYLDSFDELTGKINSDQANQSTDLNKKLTDMQKEMNDKIKRITLGTDEDTIRTVVTAILQEQEVIK
ncbi:hypothetical protein [Lactiplantibacillus plantarum]|uniref:hypothetical protein n=1 Tax=Lactiplantibacillus plantarum TaxID=1590 RepID=UPI0009768903|nr:hypothetical protein [Lactiplantibacillus plantarum]